MKIAILHEMLIKLGWAEKVVEKIVSIFPEAPIFTLIYDEEKVWKIFPKDKVKVASSTQRIYNLTKNQRFCLPFMPRAVESFDFSDYDVVICSSSGFAHGAITKPETKFIVYYHSPARYLWDWTNEYKKDIGFDKWLKWYILNKLFLSLRMWDVIASSRVDINLANSKNSNSRVQKYYRKTCEILYPPIETKRFKKEIDKVWVLESLISNNNAKNPPTPLYQGGKKEQDSSFTKEWQELSPLDKGGKRMEWARGISSINYSLSTNYYIIISALTEFKKNEIAIEWFNKMPDKNLVIIWDWNYRETLKNKVNWNNIIFTWARYGDELVELVQWSLGLVFPWEEDFWIVPIEAMAAGKPIFAYAWGWLLETVILDKTWSFFQDKTWYDFVPKFKEFDQKVNSWFFDKKFITKHASKFDENLFEKRIKEIVYW